MRPHLVFISTVFLGRFEINALKRRDAPLHVITCSRHAVSFMLLICNVVPDTDFISTASLIAAAAASAVAANSGDYHRQETTVYRQLRSIRAGRRRGWSRDEVTGARPEHDGETRESRRQQQQRAEGRRRWMNGVCEVGANTISWRHISSHGGKTSFLLSRLISRSSRLRRHLSVLWGIVLPCPTHNTQTC